MPTPPITLFRSFLRTAFLFLLALLVGLPASAQVANGGFESPYAAPTITGWTKSRWTNRLGLIIPPSGPFTGASVQKTGIGTSGTDLTSVVTAGTDSHTGFHLLSQVRFGNQAVVVNLDGDGYNGNSLTQSITIDSSFPLEADGKYHIRFAYAPVLESGGHAPNEQPFFYVGVTDTTTNGILYDSVNYSDQAGITWYDDNDFYWTDWQTVDVAMEPSSLGHTILLEFTAAGCMFNGHSGHLYVDGVAPTIQDLWISGTGPATVAAGGNITYTYTIRNDSTTTTYNNVTLSLTPPTDDQSPANHTTFVSSTLPGGGLSANIGSLLPGAAPVTYTMTVNVPLAASGKVIHGDYYVSATGYPALGGAAITTVISGPPTDLGTTVTASAAGYHQVSYLVTVTNHGASTATAAQASFTLPAGSTFVSASGPVGVLVTGSGPVLGQFGDMPSGTSKTFTVIVSMPGSTPVGTSVTGTATASGAFTNTNALGGVGSGTFIWPADLGITTSPASANYFRGTPATPLSVTTSGGWGSPTYQWYLGPVGNAAGSTLVGTGATYTPPTGVDGTYTYWVRVSDLGSSVDSAAATIFVYYTHNITATAGANGTITPGGVVAVVHGNSQTFTIAANYCHHIVDVLVDGVSQGPIVSYTFSNVTTDHTISATYSINTYALSYAAGANGFLSGNTLQVVNCGSSGTPITAAGTPGSTYQFWRWSDGSQANPRTDTNVTANLAVSATFATLEEEPNNNFVQATRVSGPGLCVGRINPFGLPTDPADYWRIILPQGSTLTATLAPPAGVLRYYFYIYNQMGQVVAQSTTIAGVANTARARNSGPAPLYYYVAVRTTTNGGQSPNYYQLTLNW